MRLAVSLMTCSIMMEVKLRSDRGGLADGMGCSHTKRIDEPQIVRVLCAAAKFGFKVITKIAEVNPMSIRSTTADTLQFKRDHGVCILVWTPALTRQTNPQRRLASPNSRKVPWWVTVALPLARTRKKWRCKLSRRRCSRWCWCIRHLTFRMAIGFFLE